ncbi:MAG: bacterial Ig-like domain-containing protein [Clostridia bacterium]
MKKEKKVALITLLVMILNMFSPYSILFNNISNAATGVLGDDPIILNNLGVTTKGSNKILTVEIAAVTEAVLNGFDFQFKIDTSKITPCNKNTGAATTSLGMIMSQSDYFLGTLQVKNYDRNTNQFHFLATEPSGGTDIADNGYIPGQVGDDAIDVNGQGYSVYYPILKLSFKLDSSVDENSLPSDLFTLVPSGAGLPTGLKVNYTNESGIRISKDLPLATKGFTNAEKQIASISVKTNPTTTAYEHGDTIDLTGGVIQVTYDDNSTEYVDMIDPSVSIATGSPADVNNPIVKLDYKGQETSFNITVTDPIQSLSVATPMTQGEYDHGDTLNFAGLTLSAVTKSGSTTTISSTTPGLTISETTANINSPNFTKTSGSSDVEVRGTQVIKFTYDGKTAQQTIIVNDKIASINVVTQPNKTVFKYGETLDITGATVKVTLESGDTTNINLPDGSATVSAFDNTQTGSKQNLTVTINDKTAPETIDVEAYNYVKETTLTEPTKVDYKYNENLDVTGGRIKVNWANGTVSNVNLTTSMVTVYNKTQLGVQTLTISYTFTYTLSDGAQIQDPITMTYEVEVTNPAKTITITPPTKTEYEHGDSLDFTGGEIEVTYEDGTTQTKQITADMVKESSGSLVNMAPTASDYVNNEVLKTLVIKYKEDSVTETVNYPIKIKNVVNKIEMSTNPTNTTYNVGDTSYKLAGGTIKVTRKAGNTEIVALTDNGVTLINLSTLTTSQGTKEVTVTYEEKTTTFNITVQNGVRSINITTPTKTTYDHGDTLDVTGGKIEVTYVDGTTQDKELDVSMITESDGSPVNMAPSTYGDTNKESKTLLIKYQEDGIQQQENYTIDIINDVKQIAIQGTAQSQYNINDQLQPGLSILVTRASGVPEAITVTNSMLTNFSTATEGTRTATITYTENGITKTTTFVYTVKDTVTSISVKNGPTNATKYGEDIDLTGVTIDVVKGSGTTTIPVTKDMIKAGTYDPDKTGNQVIKIVYEGQETTLTINVKDYVTGITINPVSVTGKYNDTLSSLIQANNIQYTVTYAKAGAQTPEVLAESMVSGYSAISTQDQNLTVTYTDTDADSYTNGKNFTTNLKVTLSKEVSSITITAPSKTTYEHGETIATDGIITVVFTDGTQETRTMDAAMITESDGSPLNMSPAASEYTNNKLSKTLKITYTEDGKTETINYPIEIVNKVQSITIKGTPKTSYNVNEALDNNIIITIHRQTGEDEDVTVTSSMIPSFDTTTETSGTPRSSDIEYTENGITLRVPYTYTVIDEVSNINVNTQPTNATKYGEDVDLTGVTIDVVKGSGTTTIPVTNDMIKPGTYDPDKTGNQVIKIVYGGQETTLTINVKDYVTGIAVNPVSVTGKYNDTLSSLIQNNNIQYTVTYAKAGAQTPEVLVENMVSGYTATSTQDQDLTVTYTDTDTDSYTNGQNFTTNLKVTLDDTITGMTLEQTGTVKTDYKYDEEFDVSNLVIVVHKLSGDQTVPVMKDMIKNYNKQQLGNQTVSVEYNGTTVGTINVTVKDYIASVVITVPSKITYKYNEELDLSDAKITITMASKPNEPTTIAVTPSMISGYNKTQVGAQTVTITYTDNENNVHTQTFGVRVEDSIKTITLENNNFKTNYKYGENLDLSGLTLKVTKESGEISTVAVTTGMISGYNPNKLGSQTLTINYEGKQFTIVVNVVDYVTDIILTPPTKDEYKIGESLSLVGGSITEKMASGANGSTISLTNSMVSGFDSTTPGTKNLTVTYVKDGKTYTKTFQVAVINTINHIEVIAPTKTDYKYGENLNLSGGSVKIYMEDGTIKNVPLTSQMVTGYSKTTPGQQMLKVTYTSDDDKKYEGYFKVTVGEDYIKDTKFVAPTKKEYRIGDTIDLTGGSITEVYASEKLGNKYDLTNSMISGFDSTTPGTKQITVTFNNKTYQYSVTVKDRTLGISIKTLPNKLEYKKGENLDLTGATLNVVKESGTQVIKITADMVSGYDKNKAGIQVIKVTYEGFTTQFSILVKEEVPATNPDEPNTPDDNKPNTSDKNNSTSNTTPSVPSIITKVEESTEPEENANEETKLEEDNKNTQEDNKESLVSGTNDNQNNNTPKDKGTQRVQEVLNILGSLLVLIALAFIIIVLAKRRKNVKIYIEEGDEKVLVGKERLTKDNRELDLNKYYNKYKEDEYKIVLSKSISKKLDKKTVSLTVHDKKESFVVNYDSKEYIYKT